MPRQRQGLLSETERTDESKVTEEEGKRQGEKGASHHGRLWSASRRATCSLGSRRQPSNLSTRCCAPANAWSVFQLVTGHASCVAETTSRSRYRVGRLVGVAPVDAECSASSWGRAPCWLVA